MRNKKGIPLIKGGQGHTAEEVQNSALNMFGLALLALVVIALALKHGGH